MDASPSTAAAEWALIQRSPDPVWVFEKPSPEKAFPEMKILQDGHPWRAAREDWAGAAKRVRESAEWQQWLAKQQSEMDRWMSRHRDRREWICGWFHDFVSPKDGSFLKWTDQIPGEETDHFFSASDPYVPLTPKLTASWIYQFRSRHSEKIVLAARLYRLTGEEKYARWAAEQLDFYAEHYPEWPESIQKGGSKLFWQSLDEAVALTKYIEAARLLDGYIDADRREKWGRQFFRPVADRLARHFQRIHNIATWHRTAEAMAALYLKDDDLWRRAIDEKFGLRRQLEAGITSDYLWWEQSFGYNNYVITALLNLFTMIGIENRAEELSRELNIAENLMLSLIPLRFPDDRIPTAADVTGIPKAPDRELFARAYRVFPTPIGLVEAQGTQDWNTLVDPPPEFTGKTALPEVTSLNLESTRMALLKAEDWQVFFHYGQLLVSHAQQEILNFSAYYRGIDITHDLGTVGYGSPLHQGFYVRGPAHNVPLINGEGQLTLPLTGELISFSDHPAAVAARVEGYQPGVTAERTLKIEGGRLLDSLRLTSETSTRLGQSLHLQGKINLPANFQPDPEFSTGRPAAFQHWKNAKVAGPVEEIEFEVEYPGFRLRLKIHGSLPFRIWQATSPDRPPDERTSLYLETEGKEVTFTTGFAPQ